MRLQPLILTLWASVVLGADPPTLILHHGKVATVDDRFSLAEAIAITSERITAVGSNDAILALAGPKTEKIDVAGKLILPGLMDTHVHAASASVYEFDHPIKEMDTVADVLEYIQSRALQAKPGDGIVVSQVFITRLRDQRFPNRQELDRVAPNNPVAFRTGPDASLNSLALKDAGIDRNFEITDGLPGKVEKDAAGEPTGILRGLGRFVKVRDSRSGPTAAQKREQLRKLLADYNAVGITSVAERDSSIDAVKMYSDLKAAGELTCRAFFSVGVSPTGDWAKVEESILKVAKHPAHEYDNMVWARGIKVYLDGGMLTGSAYLSQPWGVSPIYAISDPAYRGVLNIEPSRLRQLAQCCLENGLQPTAHSVGDGAVGLLVDTYEKINETLPVRPHRPCVTHCNFMGKEIIAKMARIGVVADMQPIWLYMDGRTLSDHFGADRLRWFQPYKTIFEQGVLVGGGSDHMQKIGSFRAVNPYNPFLGIQTTLTRQARRLEGAVHPEEAITREQAICLYTINNARLMFDEKNRGSLEVGKLADLIVLDRDILICSVDRIRETQVERTYLGGRLVHSTAKN